MEQLIIVKDAVSDSTNGGTKDREAVANEDFVLSIYGETTTIDGTKVKVLETTEAISGFAQIRCGKKIKIPFNIKGFDGKVILRAGQSTGLVKIINIGFSNYMIGAGTDSKATKNGVFELIFAEVFSDGDANPERRNRFTAEVDYKVGETLATIIKRLKDRVWDLIKAHAPNAEIIANATTLTINLPKDTTSNKWNINYKVIPCEDATGAGVDETGLKSPNAWTGSYGDLLDLFRRTEGGKGVLYNTGDGKDLYDIETGLEKNKTYNLITITSKEPEGAGRPTNVGNNVKTIVHIAYPKPGAGGDSVSSYIKALIK